MNTCKTCKWWGRWSHSSDGKVADCDKVDDNPASDVTKTFEIKVRADDDSGLITALMVGENFGCIYHEQKEVKS